MTQHSITLCLPVLRMSSSPQAAHPLRSGPFSTERRPNPLSSGSSVCASVRRSPFCISGLPAPRPSARPYPFPHQRLIRSVAASRLCARPVRSVAVYPLAAGSGSPADGRPPKFRAAPSPHPLNFQARARVRAPRISTPPCLQPCVEARSSVCARGAGARAVAFAGRCRPRA
jgi:hypothetical protein